MAVTVTGNVAQLTGGNAAQSKVTFQLINFTSLQIPRILGTAIFAATKYVVQTDPTGAFSIPITGNDSIDPAGTFYNVTFQDSAFNQVGPIKFSITGGSQSLNTLAVSP